MRKINVKWLDYFKSMEEASDSFILKMSAFLISEMEFRFGTNIDWSRMYLLYPPDGKSLSEETDLSNGKKNSKLVCYIRSKASCEDYCGYLIWYEVESNEIVKPSDNVANTNLIFMWKEWYQNSNFIQSLPNKKTKKRIIFNNLKLKIYSQLSSMPHEGKFAITLFDIEDIEKVSEALESARGKWNTQTDEARATNNPSLEQGYCHTITFDGVEDNIAYWYIDAGSAHDGIHEYLLRQLSDSDIKIKSVEIQVL
ncbi:MAG: hypothetical protein IPO48_15545 [Saprospiraceae bacterium]|nr:hypothetical protein [Saprospiraceae bacterium]